MKKLMSIFLVALIVMSCFHFSVFADSYEMISAKDAIKKYETETGEKVETNRYYFLMPNGKNGTKSDINYSYEPSWYNESTTTAGVYWWDSGIADPAIFPGYSIEKSEAQDVFYADLPKEINQVLWNNFVFISFDTIDNPENAYVRYTSDCSLPHSESEEMIYVIDPDLTKILEPSGMRICSGEWYYYYGNGCYGTLEGGTTTDCIRDDHDHSILGDVDEDFKLSVLDATYIQKVIALLTTFTEYQNRKADVDNDGEVSVLDATAIQKLLANIQ